MALTATWSYPTEVRFGAGRIGELAEACAAAEIANPLLVTDTGLASLPITARALDILDSAGFGRGLFSRVDPNPTEDNLVAGIAAFKAGGHDGVVAFGGGSGLDLGKLIALMVDQTISVWQLEDIGDWWKRAEASAIKPVVAVPTTAGTGSEVGRAGVLINPATGEKKIIFHPGMMPAVAICDPELTVGLPPAITAGTGMDAFAHCLEAYCSPSYHPMSQGIALEGLRIVKDYLPRAYRDGSDLDARAQMMSAAAMGAVAFQKGLGAIHAISHPIGATFHTHHGTTNAVVMGQVLAFNRPAIEQRIERVAAYLGLSGGFDGFTAMVAELNATLDIPANLTELGVRDPDLDRLAEMAVDDPTAAGNPVAMTVDNTRRLIAACL